MYSILIVDDEPIIRRGIKTFIDFEKYNENKGIFKNVKVNDIKKFEENKGIISKIKIWRISLGDKIHKEISFDKSGYIEALIFGDKAYLEKDEINNYKNLGTSHLLAISGLHLGVLISLIYFILLRLSLLVVSFLYIKSQ